jgi:hypothetical protein
MTIEGNALFRREFYAALGRLLYAVADADGVVSKQEREGLMELIRTRLTHRESLTDPFGTNDAWYSLFGFETAEDEIMSPGDALLSFTEFLQANRDRIDLETREICLLLADRLANSFHHTNRKERLILQQIRELLLTREELPLPSGAEGKPDKI